jgi:hypothetical protein
MLDSRLRGNDGAKEVLFSGSCRGRGKHTRCTISMILRPPRPALLRSDVVLGLVSALYALFGVVFVAAYVPQVRAVWRSGNGAADVSLPTWGLWCASATVSLLYACFVNHDMRFALVCLGNVVGCYAVTGATLLRRQRHALGANRAAAA